MNWDVIEYFFLFFQTYIAGDRVITDALCKPFSIGRFILYFQFIIFEIWAYFFRSEVDFGNHLHLFYFCRNLICVYSKKHMLDDPELVEMKRKANTRSLKEMALLLRYIY